MKKLLYTFYGILNFFLLSITTFAELSEAQKAAKAAKDAADAAEKTAFETATTLVPQGVDELFAPTKNLAALPSVTTDQVITVVIKAILEWSIYLTIIAIIIAAIYFLISRGAEEDLTKAKSIIIYLIIGLAIIAAAYGVVSGIAQFDFFAATT